MVICIPSELILSLAKYKIVRQNPRREAPLVEDLESQTSVKIVQGLNR